MSFEFDGNLDGQYFIKRNLDGDWKIYNSTLNMEEEIQSAAVKASSK